MSASNQPIAPPKTPPKNAPRLGALAVCIHDGQALLVQRRNPPDAGLWGYPGGHVEFGETLGEAAVRELHEETGVTAKPLETLGYLEMISRDEAGVVTHHFFLGAVLCAFEQGTPVADDDALAAEWVALDEVLNAARPMSARVGEVALMALSLQHGAS